MPNNELKNEEKIDLLASEWQAYLRWGFVALVRNENNSKFPEQHSLENEEKQKNNLTILFQN